MNSYAEYVSGVVRYRLQEVVDRGERVLTIITGIMTIGPVAALVLSSLMGQALILLIPLIISLSSVIINRFFAQLLRVMDLDVVNGLSHEDLIGALSRKPGNLYVLASIGGQAWYTLLNALDDHVEEPLDEFTRLEMLGELRSEEVALAKSLIALRETTARLARSLLNRGVKTLTVGYYVVLYSMPLVNIMMSMLDIHWDRFMIILVQSLLLIVMVNFMRLMGNGSMRLIFNSIPAFLISLIK